MSAHEHLSVEQFGNLRSSDFGVPVKDVMPHLEAEYANWRNNGWPEAHPGDIAHGGPRGYIDHLKQSITEEGLRVPPLVHPPTEGNPGYLSDGHHRAIALLELGGDIPYRKPMGMKWRGGAED